MGFRISQLNTVTSLLNTTKVHRLTPTQRYGTNINMASMVQHPEAKPMSPLHALSVLFGHVNKLSYQMGEEAKRQHSVLMNGFTANESSELAKFNVIDNSFFQAAVPYNLKVDAI